MYNFGVFSDFAQKCRKKSTSSLKFGKKVTKDFLVNKNMKIRYKMNLVQI